MTIGPKRFRALRGNEHHRPSGLTVADHARTALGLRVSGDDGLQEARLGVGDVEDGLAGHRIGQEADEVGRVPRLHRNADLTVGLEAADAGSMPGSGIDDNERALGGVDHHVVGGDDAREKVVDRPGELAAVRHEFGCVVQYVRCRVGGVLLVLGRAPAHHVEEQDRTLPCVGQVFGGGGCGRQTRGLALGHGGSLWFRAAGGHLWAFVCRCEGLASSFGSGVRYCK